MTDRHATLREALVAAAGRGEEGPQIDWAALFPEFGDMGAQALCDAISSEGAKDGHGECVFILS